MPDATQSFTLTVFNPAEAGSKGGWRISEIDVPGRLAKLEVRYTDQNSQEDATIAASDVEVRARNARAIELDVAKLRRSSFAAAFLANATTLRVSLNGRVHEPEIAGDAKIHFKQGSNGEWRVISNEEVSQNARQARPIGPLLRIVTTEGPMVLVIASNGPQDQIAAWARVAERFAADLLLYGAINSQIVTDADFASSSAKAENLKHGNIVAFGGPDINSFSRSTFDNWPSTSPIYFPSSDTSDQFNIQGRSFYENGTAMLTLAPHPTHDRGLTLVVHGIGSEGIARAGRLLPTRTATMIPEWVVTDRTAEWMGEGGVQAAGWYDREWGWSESMSYVQ